VLAFSGRTMSSDPALPKYVNSPETELYEKSHTLFGYHLAKQSIRTHNFSLVVEGQFDLVLAHQAGFTNTVAISGTALSEHHCALLERLSKRVVLALDADRAGINSVKRSAHIMLARGLDVKVATLPDGKDPADLVAEDPALLKNAIRNATTVIEFLIGVLKRTARDERSFRLTVRDEVLPFVLRIPDRIDREYFEQVVSEALGTTKDAVHFEVERLAQSSQTESAIPDAIESPQRATVSRYRTDELARYIYSVSLWADTQKGKEGDGLRQKLEEAVGEDAWRTLADMSEEEKNELMFRIERESETLTLDVLMEQASEYIQELRVRMLKRRLGDAREKLRTAEAAHDDAAIATYLAECSDIQKRLSTEGESR
jgi:DNA primase